MFWVDINTRDCGMAVEPLEGMTFSACALDSGGSGDIIFTASLQVDADQDVYVYTLAQSVSLPATVTGLPIQVAHTAPAGQTNKVTGVTGDVAQGTFFIFTVGQVGAIGTLVTSPTLTRLVADGGGTVSTVLMEVADVYLLPIQVSPDTGYPQQSPPFDAGTRWAALLADGQQPGPCKQGAPLAMLRLGRDACWRGRHLHVHASQCLGWPYGDGLGIGASGLCDKWSSGCVPVNPSFPTGCPLALACSIAYVGGDLFVSRYDDSYTYGIARMEGAASAASAADALGVTSYFGEGAVAARFSVAGGALYTASDGYVLRVCGDLPTTR
jgi:hypothetical protein